TTIQENEKLIKSLNEKNEKLNERLEKLINDQIMLEELNEKLTAENCLLKQKKKSKHKNVNGSTTETTQVIEFKIKDILSIKEFVNKGVNTELSNEESIEKRIDSHRILNKENVISNNEISNDSTNIEKSV